MSTINTYNEILGKTRKIAIATSIDNRANVRLVYFCHKPEKPEVLYFNTQKTREKVGEFDKNSRIAFTTVPGEGNYHVRSNNALVKRSAYTLTEIKDLFIKNIPSYEEIIKAVGDKMIVYEIHVKDALVVTKSSEPIEF